MILVVEPQFLIIHPHKQTPPPLYPTSSYIHTVDPLISEMVGPNTISDM